MVGGDVPFHLKFALTLTYPPLKCADFDQYLLITSQPSELAKKFSYREQEVNHALFNEL